MQTLFIRQRIKELRHKANLSTLDVAHKLGMDERNYKRIKSGERKKLDIELLIDIAFILKVHYTDLFPTEEAVQNRIEIRTEALEQTGITVAGSTVKLTPEAAEMRNDNRELLLEQAAIIRQQAQLIEKLQVLIAQGS